MTFRVSPDRPITFLGYILAGGFLLRIGLIFAVDSAPELFEYDRLARNLLSGEGYVYTHLGTPYRSFYSGVFYIWLTAGLYTAFPPGHTAVLIAQSFISSILAIVIFFIGRQLWSERVGLLGMFLTVTHPALVYYDTQKLHPLSFDSLAISLAVLALLSLQRDAGVIRVAVAGLALGVAILQRGSVWPLFALGVLWILFFGRPGTHRLRQGAACVLGVALVVSPWVARNYAIHGGVLQESTSAESFWVGNVLHSYGSNLLPSGQTVLSQAPRDFRAKLLSGNEREQFQLFWQDGITVVHEHPGAFLLGVVRKFLHFWTFAPQTGQLYPKMYFFLYFAYYFLVLASATLGVIHLIRARLTEPRPIPGLSLIIGTLLSVSAVYSLFYFELRHRWAIEPLLLVLASVGLLSRWKLSYRGTCEN